MNAIQQISLKLQLGIDPAIEIQPEMLRTLWRNLSRERAETGWRPTENAFSPGRAAHPSLHRAG